jgi:cobalt-zinc-cadmium efflux system protein
MDLQTGLHFHSHHEEHHHHHGGVKAESAQWPFVVQGALLGVFMVLEFALGLLAHSVALVGDSFHMLVDVASAFVSAWVITLLRRPASDSHTFAYRRADVLMAQGQGAVFIVMALLTIWEGVSRLIHPEAVDGPLVIIAAGIGILASLGILSMLRQVQRAAEGETMTFRANWLHEIQDLSGFTSTAVAGILIALTGFSRWDSLASFVVAGIMLNHARETLRESGEILMESVPDGMNLEDIRDFIESHAANPIVRNLHLWSIDEGYTSMSVHIFLADGIDCHPLQAELRQYAEGQLGIDHVTIEVLHHDLSKPHEHSSEVESL